MAMAAMFPADAPRSAASITLSARIRMPAHAAAIPRLRSRIAHPLPSRRGCRQHPELLGHAAVDAGCERVVTVQRPELRAIALDGGALAGVVLHRGHDHRRRPQVGPEQLRHPPREHAGDVLVAGVLVAEPREVRARRARPGRRPRGRRRDRGWRGRAGARPRSGAPRRSTAASAGATSSAVARSCGARYWWSTNSSQRCSHAEHARARRGPHRAGPRRRRRRPRSLRARPIRWARPDSAPADRRTP